MNFFRLAEELPNVFNCHVDAVTDENEFTVRFIFNWEDSCIHYDIANDFIWKKYFFMLNF